MNATNNSNSNSITHCGGGRITMKPRPIISLICIIYMCIYIYTHT